MSSTVEAGAEIRPFQVSVPDEELAELRRRITAARWPERETVADRSQGVQLATMRELARHWATDYDWRRVEARLQALPQFITEIDGVDIHIIHVRSKHDGALPLIVTHGWPGSIIEQLKIIDPLANPTAHGASAEDAFHLVIPSLPGHGFSGKPITTGWDPIRVARLGRADESARIHALRGAGRRLGERGHDLVSVDPGGVEAAADWDTLWSPENYLGSERTENFASPNGAVLGARHVYAVPGRLLLNHWALAGDWTVERDAIVLNGAEGQIAYRFHARDLHLVMTPAARGTSVRFRVRVDGQPPRDAHGTDVDDQGTGTVTEPRLYQLLRRPGPLAERTFEITFLDPGLHAYAFTFG